jgi:imidazolonepropionase-like amidohydrolase
MKAWVNGPGGGIDSSKETIDPEIYNAFIREAHAHKMRVFIHARIPQEVKGLIRAGTDGFAHEIDEGSPPGVDAELLELLKKRGQKVFMTLTLPAFPGAEAERFTGPDPLLRETVPPEPLKLLRQQALGIPNDEKAQNNWIARKDLTQKLIATGIRIGVGSDADHLRPTLIGWAMHTEMEEMVASGMTPADVIVAATKTNAEWLGLDELGEVAPGKSASFIVLDGNPLEDIRNTRRIQSVFLNGKQVDRAALKSAWANNNPTPRR